MVYCRNCRFYEWTVYHDTWTGGGRSEACHATGNTVSVYNPIGMAQHTSYGDPRTINADNDCSAYQPATGMQSMRRSLSGIVEGIPYGGNILLPPPPSRESPMYGVKVLPPSNHQDISPSQYESPLEIVKMRYARGEIGRDEYLAAIERLS